MNYRFFLNIRDPGTRLGGRHTSRESNLAIPRYDAKHPSFEIWQVKESLGNNRYHLKNLFGETMHFVKSINAVPGEIPEGTNVVVGYYYNNKNDPYIFSLGHVTPDETPVPPITPILTNWLTFRNGYHRPNLWEYDDESQIYLPPSLREPEEAPTSSQINALILRVRDGQLFAYRGAGFASSGPTPPWSCPGVQSDVDTTLTSGIGSATTLIPVASSDGFGSGWSLIGSESVYIDSVVDSVSLSVTRFTGSTAHDSGSVVSKAEDLPRWLDFSLIEEGGMVSLTTPRNPSTLNGPKFDGNDILEFASPERIQFRDLDGAIVGDWPFPTVTIEYIYNDGGDAPPSGGGEES